MTDSTVEGTDARVPGVDVADAAGRVPGVDVADAAADRTRPVTDRPAGPGAVDRAVAQRHTLRLLFGTQIVAGTGYTIGVALGALLAARLGGTGVSGFASSSTVVGGALLALPVTRLMRSRGRRPGLALAYLIAAVGAVIVVLAAIGHLVPVLFLGMALFGGGTTANLQARYTAVDLSTPDRRGRDLSLIVWATTIGAVVAPNLASSVDAVTHRLGLPGLAGPFAFSAVVFVLTATVISVLLRPDPLRTAQALTRLDVPVAGDRPGPATVAPGGAADRAGMWRAWREIVARPAARLGVAAVAVGHLVMVAVMSMTPVHIGQTHHADVLRVVGFVLSVHIAGMYALAPVVGALTDRVGRRGVIFMGVGVLLLACAIAGTAGESTPRLTVGLGLLGLGWSGTMVAGSTLLTESVPVWIRPAAQGLSDMLMGLAGAAGGAVSGLIVSATGYPTLTLLAALATVPLLVLALRPLPAAVSTVGG